MAVESPHLAIPEHAPATSPAAPDDDPLWYQDAIIYEAPVKSFYDSNQDGVGDFRGLTEKLDYLHSLGITCIWLLPFFPSPLKDDGYDVSDYLNVHPSYGTLDDFKAFVDAAHERHIKVLIELVVNHTSDQHPWFERARRAPRGSPERDFYVWSDTDRKFPETRIIFRDTEKSNWSYDSVAQQYYWHRFFAHQPDLNHNNPAVVDAVIDVMRFWLDLGVDALRLDAVPYLCVREGTNNENLPETHDVLRKIRRELDAAYKNRMLLAEANQWPADVRPYFGDGDECHMAFHFPLMPRMFMALRQEDRHAITEILGQTPDIPDTCQWALFLRNHDELTLEMVTDEERDYMYQVYAADPQARLNLGIRRRLAPLVENSRRRIELLHSLLFALPGTPVIYYGDELGMGDNIYLGDRNGVRTPMQWSSDRNAGFSRTDPARLYAPPIMDPVYGYQSINVEAQERYPFSLLHWMKRSIAMRRQHQVFGRGAIELVSCANRKVLAFLRRDDHETILIVVNLSRNVQPAELDLEAFAGLLPVEMAGFTEFPRITEKPYFLTLGAYASYWFTLRQEPISVAQKPAPSAPVDLKEALAKSLPALLMGGEWQGLFDSATRAVLERQALVPFLERQRWFAAKAKTVRQAWFSDWMMIRGGMTPAFVATASVGYSDESVDTYLIPLALVTGDAATRALHETPASVMARITGARKGAIVDALLDDDVCDRLLRCASEARDTPTRRGTLRGVPIGAGPDGSFEARWTRTAGDQSNSMAFLGEKYVLKLFRRIEPGLHPEFEIGRFLSERRFPRTPSLLGGVLYDRPGVESGTLAVVQAMVKHQGSGWDFTIDELRRYYERVEARIRRPEEFPPLELAQGSSGPPPFFMALEGWYLSTAGVLGRRTAELHLALADSADPAFAPEPIEGDALTATADALERHASGVLQLLEEKLPALPEQTRMIAQRVLKGRNRLMTRLKAIRRFPHLGQQIRVHGDYHLGQVLRTEEDFVILDFEGEPSRLLGERRAKYSPLKDVAGMIRSFGYATDAALISFAMTTSDDLPALEGWASTWEGWVSRAFLNGYRSLLISSSLLPSRPAFESFLRALVIDKALYEVAYELNNRPDWVRIPLGGLLELI